MLHWKTFWGFSREYFTHRTETSRWRCHWILYSPHWDESVALESVVLSLNTLLTTLGRVGGVVVCSCVGVRPTRRTWCLSGSRICSITTNNTLTPPVVCIASSTICSSEYTKRTYSSFCIIRNFLPNPASIKSKDQNKKIVLPGIEPTASRSSVPHSANCAKPLFCCLCQSIRPS